MLFGAGKLGFGLASSDFVAAGDGGGGGGSLTFTGRDDEGSAGFFRLLLEFSFALEF